MCAVMSKALHFCYGIGAFVSPMIAEPFLLNEDCSPFIDNDTTAILTAAADLRLLAPPGSIPVNDTNLPADTLMEAQQMTRVRFAFWIMAAVQVVCVNPLECRGNYIATSNNMKLVHWPLMGRLLPLIERGGAWTSSGLAQTPPHCTKCNSSPINGQCTNHRIDV